MKVKLFGLWSGALGFVVAEDDVFFCSPEIRVTAAGVCDGVEHTQWCLAALLEEGLVKTGDFLTSLGSENIPCWEPTEYDWEVPSVVHIRATKKNGERVETTRPSTYY